MEKKLKIGDEVQSFHRANWYGMVIKVESRYKANDLLTVLRTHDKCGRPHRKETKTTIDRSLVRPTGKKSPLWWGNSCTHPDHTDGETCEDRTISCHKNCICCKGI